LKNQPKSLKKSTHTKHSQKPPKTSQTETLSQKKAIETLAPTKTFQQNWSNFIEPVWKNQRRQAFSFLGRKSVRFHCLVPYFWTVFGHLRRSIVYFWFKLLILSKI
jgi:hypothetical protein